MSGGSIWTKVSKAYSSPASVFALTKIPSGFTCSRYPSLPSSGFTVSFSEKSMQSLSGLPTKAGRTCIRRSELAMYFAVGVLRPRLAKHSRVDEESV